MTTAGCGFGGGGCGCCRRTAGGGGITAGGGGGGITAGAGGIFFGHDRVSTKKNLVKIINIFVSLWMFFVYGR